MLKRFARPWNFETITEPLKAITEELRLLAEVNSESIRENREKISVLENENIGLAVERTRAGRVCEKITALLSPGD